MTGMALCWNALVPMYLGCLGPFQERTLALDASVRSVRAVLFNAQREAGFWHNTVLVRTVCKSGCQLEKGGDHGCGSKYC